MSTPYTHYTIKSRDGARVLARVPECKTVWETFYSLVFFSLVLKSHSGDYKLMYFKDVNGHDGKARYLTKIISGRKKMIVFPYVREEREGIPYCISQCPSYCKTEVSFWVTHYIYESGSFKKTSGTHIQRFLAIAEHVLGLKEITMFNLQPIASHGPYVPPSTMYLDPHAEMALEEM